MRDYKKYKVWELGHKVTLAILARNLGYIDDPEYIELDNSINKTKRSLNKLIQKL